MSAPPPPEGPVPAVAAAAALEAMLQRALALTRTLAADNERLRQQLAAAAVAAPSAKVVPELQAQLQRVAGERDQVARRFAQLEDEARALAERAARAEDESSNMMAIYVASHQLHATLDFQEVIESIAEIITNFVGAEAFALVWIEEGQATLTPLWTAGVEAAAVARLDTRSGCIGAAIEAGQAHFDERLDGALRPVEAPAVCLPLSVHGRTIGLVLVHRFLAHKTALSATDHELFKLLAAHAATAICAAKLYTDSRRKLSTIQGLIDLVTS